MRTAIRNILFQEDEATNALWDLDIFSSTDLGFWLSLHPQATRQSAITIATGISAATDVSGNSRNLSQSTGNAQPTYQLTGFNTFPCLSFDGANDFMESSFNLSGNPEFTVMAIYKKNDATKGHLYAWGTGTLPLAAHGLYDDNNFTIFGYGGGQSYGIPSIGTDPLILEYLKPAGAINLSTAYKNGILQTPSSSSANTPNIGSQGLRLGRWADQSFYLNGLIAEFAVWQRLLTLKERQQVEGIWAHRWWRLAGLPVPLPPSNPYYSSPPMR